MDFCQRLVPIEQASMHSQYVSSIDSDSKFLTYTIVVACTTLFVSIPLLPDENFVL